MDEKKLEQNNFLAEKFEANRAHLRAVAYRMLGSTGEVDDAVQETWLRLSRSDTSSVENLGRKPRRLADHGGRSRLPRHAALAQIAARGSDGSARTGARRRR
jgi:hypothetical protein